MTNLQVITAESIFELQEKDTNGQLKITILYADFNVLNYLYINRITVPNSIIVYPDSTAVYIYIKYCQKKKITKIISTDLQHTLLEKMIFENKKIYFLGDSKEILKSLEKKLKLKYPNIKIVGLQSGYNFNSDYIIKNINKMKPDILFIGLGLSRQEKWIIENYSQIDSKIIIAVGGWFQYLAGKKKRAPKLLRKFHLEWLLKLIIEFPRVWKRYLIGFPLFCFRVISKKIIISLND